jgi:hypothetical protein
MTPDEIRARIDEVRDALRQGRLIANLKTIKSR